MKIATWNVNSVRARLPNVLEWIKTTNPDVLLLQEIKCETTSFPSLEFEALGFKVHAFGQKSYNGVALLSRHALDNIRENLPASEPDPQARYVEATICGCRIASLYLPNGNPISTDLNTFTPSEKFIYKLDWMEKLRRHASHLLKTEQPIILGGDFNIIPEARDVYDPKGWELDALFHPKSRAAYQSIVNLGYTEAYRALHPETNHAYTFWDYQAGAWQKDHGLRIDHFLISPEAVDRVVSCSIDKDPRGNDKASDHTPLILELTDV